MALRRGFKAEAERTAKDVWGEMDLASGDIMTATALAKHIGCVVRAADELVAVEKLQRLRDIQDDAFFACTFKIPGNRHAIVYNPLMSEKRRNSDIAHEVSHIILDHRLSRLERLGEVAFLSCDKRQEEEAAWLSGCLLLPRPTLIHDLSKGMTSTTISDLRNLSSSMVDYRVRVTGVNRQLAARQRRSPHSNA